MIDVSLVGNLVLDKVMYTSYTQVGRNNRIFKTEKRAGGLANMLPALGDLDIFLTSNVGETYDIESLIPSGDLLTTRLFHNGKSSVATIVADSMQRTSFVEWNDGVEAAGLLPVQCKWTHISYLDVLKNLDMDGVRDVSGTVSADLCLSDPEPEDSERMMGYAENVDVLFMSSAELHSHGHNLGLTKAAGLAEMMKELREMTGVKILVCHDDGYSAAVTASDGPVQVATTVVRNVDVTGAGDLFTGFFIRSALDQKGIEGSLSFANENVGIILMNRIINQ